MYWRSEERKTGMRVPPRAQMMMEAMNRVHTTTPVNSALVEDLFRKNISKIDIAKEMAISK